MGTVKSTAPCQRFFSRLRRSWLRPTAEDVSAFGQHRKFPPQARKNSGTQGTCTPIEGLFLLPASIQVQIIAKGIRGNETATIETVRTKLLRHVTE